MHGLACVRVLSNILVQSFSVKNVEQNALMRLSVMEFTTSTIQVGIFKNQL